MDTTECLFDREGQRNVIGQQIRTLIDQADPCKVSMAVAYVSELDQFMDLEKVGNLRLICDAMSGGCNPHTLDKLRKMKNVEIRICGELHAKVYVIDDKAVIASANATPNGLGAGKLEAGILLEGEQSREAEQWFDELWESADRIEDISNLQWDTLKARWATNPRGGGKTGTNGTGKQRPTLGELILADCVPSEVGFGFYEEGEDPSYPSVQEVQDSIGLKTGANVLDYWVETENPSKDDEKKLRKVLRECQKRSVYFFGMKIDDWDNPQVSASGAGFGLPLALPVVHEANGQRLLLSLYYDSGKKDYFRFTKACAELITKGLRKNLTAWQAYRKTPNGEFGWFPGDDLLKLVKDGLAKP